MKAHEHWCRVCFDAFTCRGCPFPDMQYRVCPDCYTKSTFGEAQKKRGGIAA